MGAHFQALDEAVFVVPFDSWYTQVGSYLNRDEIESNLSVLGIQGYHEFALYKSFKMIPHLICDRLRRENTEFLEALFTTLEQ